MISEVATELLKEIACCAETGSALVLGPQAVRNLRELLNDILHVAASAATPTVTTPPDQRICEKSPSGLHHSSCYPCAYCGTERTGVVWRKSYADTSIQCEGVYSGDQSDHEMLMQRTQQPFTDQKLTIEVALREVERCRRYSNPVLNEAVIVVLRAARLAEEAMEVAQAEGVPIDVLQRIAARIYSRAPGELGQEVGGIGITLYALTANCGLDLFGEIEREWRRGPVQAAGLVAVQACRESGSRNRRSLADTTAKIGLYGLRRLWLNVSTVETSSTGEQK